MDEKLHKYQVAIIWLHPLKVGFNVKGSGILISENLVLTCAHNFTTKKYSKEGKFKVNGWYQYCYDICCSIRDTTWALKILGYLYSKGYVYE